MRHPDPWPLPDPSSGPQDLQACVASALRSIAAMRAERVQAPMRDARRTLAAVQDATRRRRRPEGA